MTIDFIDGLSIDEVVKAAQDAHALGKSWHFHMLGPTCKFNTRANQHALVVEISSDNLNYRAFSEERPMHVGQQLLALLHGKKILQGSGNTLSVSNPTAAVIVERAKNLNARGVAWHHHLFFPQCELNPSPGSWSLSFEDPETGKVLSALYQQEPIADLKEVEALFYAQSK